ncbi:8-oxo-dGTP diphosphatase [Peptoniphilus asaccharolyticus DSM 20463]|uniref:8-oxo-dGTP diphosphatase n=1 Tax=Peptoniphilus asaccharolyticus DSM 20463 TaxID=573058 RepID=A0A1W1UGH7_PEPAS|nr:(deoxy)nucleoside triphosphate pyrophosphohydrolase [Peptoniphilus asaccharolyticus]MBL7574687.1 (deoxy)nucleoside triphosphate pyrophosphohydrolase [Peptoniphilus asaccharolyticus]SMB80170.1 8-oxo-dGTP diphosphatase [Peptoniphilus asaccharolyticus DSM 20463]
MNRIRVVAAVIKEENRFFIAQRGYGKLKGFWEFPGGKVESGESDEAALKREIREELQSEIEVEELLCNITHDYEDFSVDLYIYMAKLIDGDLKLLEHMDSKWVRIDEFDKFNFLSGNVEVIERLRKFK